MPILNWYKIAIYPGIFSLMHVNSEQRAALGAFLRARRETLRPEQFGLPCHGRRRTRGLRREEVAQLAGLSTTWYTWLEQGRDMSMSAAALSRLADALALSEAERAYLFELSRHRDPRIAASPQRSDLPASFRPLVDALSCPAYVADRLWRARCWNEAAADLLRPWLVEGEPSLLRYMFLTPSARAFVVDWEDRARRLLAEFRAETAIAPDDPDIVELVAELGRGSADFNRLWHDHRVLAREGGLRIFDHPDRGRVRAEQMTLAPIGHPDHRLIVLLSLPA